MKTRVISLLCVVLGALPAPAQDGFMFDHLTVKHGLSQGTVICILQDRQGFMWFGTQDGLNRFDGYRFSVFKKDPADSSTLNDNFILSIAEDTSGTLWIGTLNAPGILNRFDRVTQTFTHVPADSVNLAGMRVGAARPDYRDPAGVRWFGTLGEGLKRFDPNTGKTTSFKHDPGNAASIASDNVYSVVGDHFGMIWLGTRDGLDRLDPKTGIFVHYKHDPKNPASISDDWVWPILEDRNGLLWVGTFRGGLNLLDRASGRFSRYRHDDAKPRGLAGDRLYSLYQDRSGMIWTGLGDLGVDRFHPEMTAFRHYRKDPTNPSGLSEDNITALFVDRSGIVWIGTRTGLNRWDRSSGRFSQYPQTGPKAIGANAQCFLEDRSGTVWLGNLSSGLDRLETKTGQIITYRNSPLDPRSISDNRIYALCEDRGGNIWIGTYGEGLNRFDRKTGTFTRYAPNASVPGSLAAAGIWALLEDRDGRLWVGTSGGGVDRFDPTTGEFAHHQRDANNPQSISDNMILCLFEDRSGTLWVGTTGGLNRMDRQTGAFESFREKDGLANDMVFGILEDGNGNLWMSTNKGISRLDPRTRTIRNFDFNDGLQGDEFNQGAYAKDPRTGEMFFGGANGFNVFHPNRVKDNPFVPPVVFSSFIRYNTDDEEGRPIEEKGIDAKPAIVLSYKDNVANFEFAALNFYSTFKNRYAYKLEGYSDNWIQLGTDRRATFTNLDGGDYILRVRGSNNDGVWNNEGASLALRVNPPWWKTNWAYGSYFLMVIGFLYVSRRFEMRQREQKAKMREAELHAKAVEADKKALQAEKRALQAENDRQTKELEDARRLQLSLLPKDVPKLLDYDIAVFMKTATEVGGDYYDFNMGEENTLDVALGDATGHGMLAGTIVTLMKGLFLSDASRFDIQKFFNHCSRAIKEIRLGRLFMAFTLVRLKGKSVSLSSAGMPPVYIHRNSDGAVEEILLKGMPLGAMKNFPYSLHETELYAGDTLLLLTDGLPEQKNSSEEMFDYARLQKEFVAAVAQTPAEIITHLVDAGDAWMKGVVQDDDITLLVIRKKHESREGGA
jgi:ligand-binding sensor domain-containing protein/serine phosphatase RsbU (regulator of sigma subunit)